MKKFLVSFILSLLFVVPSVLAQDCTAYFPVEKGKKMVYEHYDKKGKPTAKNTLYVDDVEQTADGIKIHTQNWIESSEGEVVDTIYLDYYCKGGEFYMDMKSTLSGVLGKYEGMDLNVTSHDLALPASLKVGDVLPDGEITVEVRNNGIKLVTITSAVRNRKVEAHEKLTTPAGTFDCYKVSYDTDGKVGFVKTHSKGVSWYAKNIGTVKTEVYDKKGKLTGSSQLIELK